MVDPSIDIVTFSGRLILAMDNYKKTLIFNLAGLSKGENEWP